MPTPSDIRNIIDPIKPEWIPDKPYYISLKKIYENDGSYGLSDDELDYIKAYESHMSAKLR
jgi:hypothetical protein